MRVAFGIGCLAVPSSSLLGEKRLLEGFVVDGVEWGLFAFWAWNDWRYGYFASLEFLDLSGHPLEEVSDLGARRFTDMDRERFASVIR